ncbi:ATP synthase complex subunit H-domain-containing protein [Zychaea mexicana]|uniref:ATP synthase complex subunit H-domain-containing protein n=1 Tax=Zychaea mexicana TaxID=64656 RepID=UPI0022FE5ED6|nr:ATP synthase complex subunit H-domain-containing protein [Zychaea mexicana]KAI9498943.1 ATP synthase complex subunit H-domain-containing protein [Zychaea mexicana]
MSSVARIALGSIASKAPFTVRAMAARGVATSAVMQKDVVQELYLKELKGYKPAPASQADESQVKELKLPAAPQAPSVDADLAEQLAKYDAEPEEATQ